jgi:hypothetical protein
MPAAAKVWKSAAAGWPATTMRPASSERSRNGFVFGAGVAGAGAGDVAATAGAAPVFSTVAQDDSIAASTMTSAAAGTQGNDRFMVCAPG